MYTYQRPDLSLNHERISPVFDGPTRILKFWDKTFVVTLPRKFFPRIFTTAQADITPANVSCYSYIATVYLA